eukprot:203367-Rhodomonas_salina.4
MELTSNLCERRGIGQYRTSHSSCKNHRTGCSTLPAMPGSGSVANPGSNIACVSTGHRGA